MGVTLDRSIEIFGVPAEMVEGWKQQLREPHRHYHTLEHLRECFGRFADIRKLAQHPEEVEIALWYHDAIYDVKKSDNEERSAELAWNAAKESGVRLEAADRIRSIE